MTAKRLFLSQVDNSFDPAHDAVIGPWCFVGAEDIYPSWHELDFIDVLGTREALDENDVITRHLVWSLIEDWGKKLNQRHHISYSNRYWRFVLISWMLAAVQGFWSRYIHIREFVRIYGDTAYHIRLSPKEPPASFKGFFDFQHHQRRSPRFDYWVSSQIVRALAPVKWKLEDMEGHDGWGGFQDIPNPPPLSGNENISRLGRMARQVFGRLPLDSVPGMRYSKVLFSLALMLLPARGRGETFYTALPARTEAPFPKDFLELLSGFLESTLPSAYDGDFPELDARASRQRTTTGRIFVGNYMPSEEYTRLVLAHALEQGEKLVSIQHGGGYGIARHNSWAAEFEYALHGFLSWGFCRHGNYPGRYIPLPSPLLTKVRNKHREQRATIAMVATKTDMGDIRPFGPRPKDWINYRNLKVDFLNALVPETRENLVYYAYRRGATDLDDETFLEGRVGPLTVAASGLNRDMMSARLLVLDHPGSTLNLAFAANVPTICYWNPDSWLFADQAQSFFDQLREVGILYDDPEAAARHLNTIWNNVEDWWTSAPVQQARSSWADNFARTDRFWWWSWLKTLAALQTDGVASPDLENADNPSVSAPAS
jgi:putative transferase (TIGR04331 family)